MGRGQGQGQQAGTSGTQGRACLHCYTTDEAHRSVGYAGYVSTLSPMGKSICLILVHLIHLLMHLM